MAYHPDYWLAVAAGAPVIALANTVTITSANELFRRWSQQRKLFKAVGVVVPTIGAIVVFVSQAWVLAVALGSLGDQKDIARPPVVTPIEVGALIVILYLAGLIAVAPAKPTTEGVNRDGESAYRHPG